MGADWEDLQDEGWNSNYLANIQADGGIGAFLEQFCLQLEDVSPKALLTYEEFSQPIASIDEGPFLQQGPKETVKKSKVDEVAAKKIHTFPEPQNFTISVKILSLILLTAVLFIVVGNSVKRGLQKK